MSRLTADLILLLTAIIWGTAFIAQKTGMDGVGPFLFVASRFALSFFVVLPFAFREAGKVPVLPGRSDYLGMIGLCAVFFGGVILQQIGIASTTVTNAGFITGLYVIMVPMVAWLFLRQKPAAKIWGACGLAILGTWFLNDATLAAFTRGDWIILGSAAFYAAQVVLLGLLVQKTSRPLFFVTIQYAACTLVGLLGAFVFEEVSWAALQANWFQIAYAGVISGGIAYTLQAIGQQYTPSSDAAIILSGEALFAALAGFVILGERLPGLGWLGCALILLAILLVEVRMPKVFALGRKPG